VFFASSGKLVITDGSMMNEGEVMGEEVVALLRCFENFGSTSGLGMNEGLEANTPQMTFECRFAVCKISEMALPQKDASRSKRKNEHRTDRQLLAIQKKPSVQMVASRHVLSGHVYDVMKTISFKHILLAYYCTVSINRSFIRS
jgi:hypothetical protein